MRIDAEQQPDVRAVYGTKFFRLMAEYDTWFGPVIPAGFVCDMASIWRWFWSFAGVRLGGRIRAAALVHDWLYYHCGEAPGDILRSRANVDDVFRILMRDAGMERWRIFKCYWAVRVGGWRAWNAHKLRIALDKELDETWAEAGECCGQCGNTTANLFAGLCSACSHGEAADDRADD